MKVKTIITTDGEVDDMNSMIRALLYSNEYDICGIILTSSQYHYAGDDKHPPYRWTGSNWIDEMIDEYEMAYDNLKSHDNYPTPNRLRSITHIGNISYKGEMDKDTEGSKFLAKLFLHEKGPLYVQTWGGTNTTARALKSIEEKYSNDNNWYSIQQSIYEKLILYIILDQDETYQNYIALHWPKLKVINDRSNFWHFAYAWKMHDDHLNSTLHAKWNKENIVSDVPLIRKYALIGDHKTLDGELYDELRGTDDYLIKNPQYERFDFISEGDSPSFFYLIDRGLRSLENPSYGGWGGRFSPINNTTYVNNVMDYNPYTKQYELSYTLTRWFDAIQNDFAARIDWIKTNDDTKVEHLPKFEIIEGLDLYGQNNQIIKLHLHSLDNRKYHYNCWHYHEADIRKNKKILNNKKIINIEGLLIDEMIDSHYQEEVIIHLDNDIIDIELPNTLSHGDTIHIIVEAIDSGQHHIKSYQRVIINIK